MSFINKLISNANNISRLLDLTDKAPKWRKRLMEKKNGNCSTPTATVSSPTPRSARPT